MPSPAHIIQQEGKSLDRGPREQPASVLPEDPWQRLERKRSPPFAHPVPGSRVKVSQLLRRFASKVGDTRSLKDRWEISFSAAQTALKWSALCETLGGESWHIKRKIKNSSANLTSGWAPTTRHYPLASWGLHVGHPRSRAAVVGSHTRAITRQLGTRN